MLLAWSRRARRAPVRPAASSRPSRASSVVVAAGTETAGRTQPLSRSLVSRAHFAASFRWARGKRVSSRRDQPSG